MCEIRADHNSNIVVRLLDYSNNRGLKSDPITLQRSLFDYSIVQKNFHKSNNSFNFERLLYNTRTIEQGSLKSEGSSDN
jgi:hypothetical protein